MFEVNQSSHGKVTDCDWAGEEIVRKGNSMYLSRSYQDDEIKFPARNVNHDGRFTEPSQGHRLGILVGSFPAM